MLQKPVKKHVSCQIVDLAFQTNLRNCRIWLNLAILWLTRPIVSFVRTLPNDTHWNPQAQLAGPILKLFVLLWYVVFWQIEIGFHVSVLLSFMNFIIYNIVKEAGDPLALWICRLFWQLSITGHIENWQFCFLWQQIVKLSVLARHISYKFTCQLSAYGQSKLGNERAIISVVIIKSYFAHNGL